MFLWWTPEKCWKYLPVINLGRLESLVTVSFKSIILSPTQIFLGLKRFLKWRTIGIALTL